MKTLLFLSLFLITLFINAQTTTFNTTAPLLINTGTTTTFNLGGTYSWTLSGISGYGSANQFIGMNSGATALEYKDFVVSTSGTDFAITFPALTNDISFNLPDASTSARGVVSTGSQTFGGSKTFDGNVTLSTSRTLNLWNGGETTPSLLFSDNNTGFSFSTSPSNTLFLSFDGAYRYQFLNGEFDMTNGADFVAGGGKLDINITHDAGVEYQDGGISVSTYGGTDHEPPGDLKCGTFGARTAAGIESNPESNYQDQRLAEFIGKGYVDCEGAGCGWEADNRGVFGVYAAELHDLSGQGAYCKIRTTRINTTQAHNSVLVDHAGNLGLTANTEIPQNYPYGWASTTDYDNRFLTIESFTQTTDVGLLLQNSNGQRGLNIWLDNDANITYIDNIRTSNAATIQTRLQTGGDGSSTEVKMTVSHNGVNIGTDATPNNVFSVGSSSQFQIDVNGKIPQYGNATPGSGKLLIGTASLMELGSLTQPSAGLTISYSNPNLVFALANDLAAIEGLSTSGIAVRTASDSWTTRTITAGTGITITNGDGVSGNPIINAVPGAVIGGTGNQNISIGGGQVAYAPILGTSSFSTTEADRQLVMPYGGTISKLYIVTSSIQTGGTLVCTIKINGSTSGVVATVTSGGTAGTYTDLSNSIAFNAGDLVSLQCVNNGSGASAKVISWSVIVTQ